VKTRSQKGVRVSLRASSGPRVDGGARWQKAGWRQDKEGDDPRQERTIGTDEMRVSIIGWVFMDGSASGS